MLRPHFDQMLLKQANDLTAGTSRRCLGNSSRCIGTHSQYIGTSYHSIGIHIQYAVIEGAEGEQSE